MNIPFDQSTQAKSWCFDADTLVKCRQHCVALGGSYCSGNFKAGSSVRNFASGFKGDVLLDPSVLSKSKDHDFSAPILSPMEQEAVVRFHANQICVLVGPGALFPELRRSSSVVATAIALFRRFYLSNSVLDCPPHRVKAAAVFLASKVEEEHVNIKTLADATAYIHGKAKASPLYRNELRAVSTMEIEESERSLLKGVNYEIICFHPIDTIRALSQDLSSYIAGSFRLRHAANHADVIGETVHATAQALCYRALVGTDAPFLFAPVKIAFAISTIALRSSTWDGLAGQEMEGFLRFCFPYTPPSELKALEGEIEQIVAFLTKCPQMELGDAGRWNEAEEVWQVFTKVAKVRKFWSSASRKTKQTTERSRKRARSELELSSKMSRWTKRMCPKVTPISQN